MKYEELANQLHAAIPEFTPIIEEHMADNGEVLPHLLFGDLTRFVEAAWERNETDLVNRSLVMLETALTTGDDQVRNLVAVSFVENVGPWDKAKAGFIATWPTQLQNEARRQGWLH